MTPAQRPGFMTRRAPLWRAAGLDCSERSGGLNWMCVDCDSGPLLDGHSSMG